ncbi:FAS1-like dehydratase domain-containing protein [[Mycobacterium] nativiensis]|uniref:MaoC family dehydratase N-terminal domain-containing protein n=1 Tax=[Mycobacterium] nativiensis TaxID=2855503 RepID=A0ABU5XTG0_9MYCO|nr:MaoC family dehydratase N-terminal domain-containing protein [Mycolicibacter sp. MYC340]MEB3031218.1 MaoC family dehydratase N-terminal domain-containing protein [Mycolicibacter sp. MYC340]
MAIARFPIEAGHVLAFARAIGDTAAAFSDREFQRTGLVGAVVPPTFVQAGAQFDPHYPLRPHPGQAWPPAPAAEKTAGGNGDRGPATTTAGPPLHAEQRFEYRRPVRIGDVLSAAQRPGRTWEKTRRDGGRLLFSESITEFRNQDDELVVTATAVAVRVQSADVREEVTR